MSALGREQPARLRVQSTEIGQKRPSATGLHSDAGGKIAARIEKQCLQIYTLKSKASGVAHNELMELSTYRYTQL
jgi:hypothetical protein